MWGRGAAQGEASWAWGSGRPRGSILEVVGPGDRRGQVPGESTSGGKAPGWGVWGWLGLQRLVRSRARSPSMGFGA